MLLSQAWNVLFIEEYFHFHIGFILIPPVPSAAAHLHGKRRTDVGIQAALGRWELPKAEGGFFFFLLASTTKMENPSLYGKRPN